MAQTTLWKGVRVAMQSAIGAAVTITGITKASPAVVTASAHGFSNGDYVLLNVQGMTQVNGRLFRVAASTAGSFTLEGEDATLYDTFVSGSVQKITFGTTFSSFYDFSVTGGEASDIDDTTVHDVQAQTFPGLPSAIVITANSRWDVSDPALKAAEAASRVQALRAFMLTFQNGQRYLINGYPTTNLNPTGSAQEKVTTPFKINGKGGSTTYAS